MSGLKDTLETAEGMIRATLQFAQWGKVFHVHATNA